MYVCNCNGITERQVRDAIRAGVRRWDEVHARYDCAPRCGMCECEIARAIDAEETEQAA